ncbi:Triacylglycerol lipase OBL1 [Linum perenne]
MLLDYDKIAILDLIRLLFSTNIEQRKFIDSKEGKEEIFKRRWIIFVSIVVQKLLQLISKPLYFVGWCIEMWLSLLTNNCGLLGLLVNILTCKLLFFPPVSGRVGSWVGRVAEMLKLVGWAGYGLS